MIRLMAVDELGYDFCVEVCDILSMDNISREEKSSYANYLLDKAKEKYPEASYFHFEKDYTYFDEDGAFDYFLMIAEDEGLEGSKAWCWAHDRVNEAILEHNDIGFDY